MKNQYEVKYRISNLDLPGKYHQRPKTARFATLAEAKAFIRKRRKTGLDKQLKYHVFKRDSQGNYSILVSDWAEKTSHDMFLITRSAQRKSDSKKLGGK